MTELCKLSYKITSDPVKYQRYKDKPWGKSPDCLTKKYFPSSTGAWISYHKGEQRYLSMDHNFGLRKYDNQDWQWQCQCQFRQWRFADVDRDEKAVNIRLDSTLHTAGRHLNPGTIIFIKKYIPVYWKYDEHARRNFAIVVLDLEIVSHHELKEELVNGRQKEWANPTMDAKPKREKKKSRNTNQITVPPTGQQCSGNLCSCYGVNFVMCITDCVPIQSDTLPW